MPITIPGNICGATTKAVTTDLPKKRPRTSENAAGIPINIDKTVVTKAIHKLVTAESISCCLSNSSEYHFNENPLGGKPI